MQGDYPLTVMFISTETSATAGLAAASRWLIECRHDSIRLDAHDLPALSQDTRLQLALPMTAPRAVLCALWLFEDGDAGGCLLAGQLRFVAHPTGSNIKLSFRGRTARAMRSGELRRQAAHAARQLLELIAASIECATSSRLAQAI